MKDLFRDTPGFGDVCYENWGRYPSVETLEREDVRPANVQKLPVDTGVNPITHDVRVNHTEFRRIMILIDERFARVLNVDGIRWLMSTMCQNMDPSNNIIHFSHDFS